MYALPKVVVIYGTSIVVVWDLKFNLADVYVCMYASVSVCMCVSLSLDVLGP